MITGASTGIGRATALHLDSDGFRVFAGVRRDRDAESLSKEASGRLQPLHLDVVDPLSIESARKTVHAALGQAGLQGIVNNAGISVAAPFEFLDLDELRRQLEVNVVGPVAVTQAFLPLIRKGGGRIVNIGSIGGRMAAPILGPYAISKFAMEAFSDSLRVELKPWGIHVSLVEPGSIATPIFGKGQAYADKTRSELPAEALEYYATSIEAVRGAFREMERAAIPPKHAARAIQHALTAKRPRTRYLVGLDARIQALLAWLLPDRLRDAVLTRLWKYPRSARDLA